MREYNRDDDEDVLTRLRFVDSLFGATLFLTKDGRKRGLWVWLGDEINTRLRNDSRLFDSGLERFQKWLDDPDGYRKEPSDLQFQLKELCFSPFFSHRTEDSSVRMTWIQVKKLADALAAGVASELEKSEEDCDPDQR